MPLALPDLASNYGVYYVVAKDVSGQVFITLQM